MWHKLLTLTLIVCCLTGCQEQQNYTRLIEDQNFLSNTLMTCQQEKASTPMCEQAQLVKQVINEFTAHSANFIIAQQKLLTIQQQLQTAPDNTDLQNAYLQQQTVLNIEFMNLQEDIAMQIMATETNLANLKIMQDKIRAALKTANEAQKTDLLQKQASIEQQIISSKEKLKVMLLFIKLSNSVEG